MSLCLATAALAVGLAAQSFTLAWTHSVEQTEWRETWRVDGDDLVLTEARVRGSGAGMEPPEGAMLHEGWWVYKTPLRVPALNLAVSGATVAGWQLCTGGPCIELEKMLTLAGRLPGAIRITGSKRCRPLPGRER